MHRKLKRICLGFIIAMACTTPIFAQQTGTAQQDNADAEVRQRGRMRGQRGGKRDHKMMGMMRALREVNLTDAQQLQARAILERFAQSTQPQREALRQLHAQREEGMPSDETSTRAKQLRGEIRESMQQARAEIVGILTTEQRAKFEQMEMERKARHEERRGRRRAERENEQ